MNIQQIKYNQELIKNKIKLTRQLKEINNEIEEAQKNCEHVIVKAGYCDSSLYRDTAITECLFCRTEVFSSHEYPFIDAITYKRVIYSDGSSEDDRNERIKALQNLWIKNMIEYPEATQQELVTKMKEDIEEDEKKNKATEKTLRLKFI